LLDRLMIMKALDLWIDDSSASFLKSF